MFDINEKRVKLREVKTQPINYIDETDMKITLLNFPDMNTVREYIPELSMATWNENIDEFNGSLTEDDKDRFLFRALQGKFIPTTIRSMNITFKIENMSWHDVSHLIRHSGFSFAADCSGDKIIEGRDIILPPAVVESGCFEKYDTAMKLLEECYADIINNGGHIQDARLMLPRTMTTFYYVTGNLDYVISFIKQRIDRQVQPKSDNIMAMKLLLALCEKIPYLYFIINPNMQNNFYVRESTTNFASKWQRPLPQNEKGLEGKEIDWLYDKSRDEMIGNSKFVEVFNELLTVFENRKTTYLENNQKMKEIIYDCTEGEWK